MNIKDRPPSSAGAFNGYVMVLPDGEIVGGAASTMHYNSIANRLAKEHKKPITILLDQAGEYHYVGKGISLEHIMENKK